MPGWSAKPLAESSEGQSLRFVARQPILDRRRRTYGYELLFRSGWENRFTGNDEIASRTVFDNVTSFGLESLIGSAIPFVNCTGEVLLQELPTLLPRHTVLEILETVHVDRELVAACNRLRALGYKLALDDFDFSARWEPLLPYVDYIKVDFRSSSVDDRRAILKRMRYCEVQLVAEKVETGAEFQIGMDEGFHLFQGYFFTKPVVLSRPALSAVVSRIRLLAELNRPELHIPNMVRILREESAVCYRLLRLANSVLMNRGKPLTDIHNALLMVGEDEFRKLASAALTAELCGTQPLETHRVILQMARFCELMSPALDCSESELYVFGMLSVIRSVLNLSPESLSGAVQLRPEMMNALLGNENVFGDLLRCSSSYAQGDWETFSSASSSLGRPERELVDVISSARHWADTIVSAAR